VNNPASTGSFHFAMSAHSADFAFPSC
jgi:hypothetical protein